MRHDDTALTEKIHHKPIDEKDRKTDKRLIYALMPMRCVMFLIVFLSASAITGRGYDSLCGIWSPTATCVNILTIIILMLYARRNGMTFTELIHLRKGQSKAGRFLIVSAITVVSGMALLYAAGYICYGSIMPPVSLRIMSPVPAALAAANLLLLPLTTALAEDGLYLGTGTGHLKGITAIVLPSLFYAMQHGFIPFMPDLRYFIYRVISFLPLTVAFCLYYRKTKDILPLMTGHILLDLATSSGILAMSAIPGLYEQMQTMIT
ncbi:MAG: CPBP family intramembrane metalloprotease [Oscillospiraceae bacterium]|nr:CPBP family intramembrane metalloprotease [Oscillospiraceae bacterium]